jgi:hypothetical protein
MSNQQLVFLIGDAVGLGNHEGFKQLVKHPPEKPASEYNCMKLRQGDENAL